MQIELRPWRMEDAGTLVTLANNPNVAGFMTDGFPHPYGPADAERFITFATSHDPCRIFAIIYNGEIAGGIGVHPQQDIWKRNAELGYWVAEPFWGKGIATEAIGKIVEIGFNLDGITRIFARPFGTNLASRRVLEKNNFVLEATIPNGLYKNGRYLDELIYAVRKKNVLQK